MKTDFSWYSKNSNSISPEEARWRRLLDTESGRKSFSSDEDKFVHIDCFGRASMISVGRHELLRLGARFRDLILLDPCLTLPVASVLLIRSRAIIVNLAVGPSSSIRMVICENQVYVLALPKADDPSVTALPTIDHPIVARLCKYLSSKTNGVGNNLSNDNYDTLSENGMKDRVASSIGVDHNKVGDQVDEEYLSSKRREEEYSLTSNDSELDDHVAEASPNPLDRTSQSKDDIDDVASSILEFGDSESIEKIPYCLRALEIALSSSLGLLDYEVEDLEIRAYPAIEALLNEVNRGTLEAIHEVKSSIDKIRSRVERLHQELEELLEDDEDINDMYLERRATCEDWPVLPQPWSAKALDVDLMAPQTTFRKFKQKENADSDFSYSSYMDRERKRRRKRRLLMKKTPTRRRRSVKQDETSSAHFRRSSIPRNTSRHVSFADIPYTSSADESLFDGFYSETDSQAADDALEQAEEELLERSKAPTGDDTDHWSMSPNGRPLYSPVSPHQIEEAEDLLETSFVRADLLLRRLALVDERVDDTEQLLALDLDKRRNDIVTLDVVVSTLAAALGMMAAIGGIFGMNLFNVELQNSPWALWTVLAVMIVLSVALFGAVLWYMRYRHLLFVPSRL